MKRKDYISWDELFIGVAELASKRSKDPRTQNGVCLVNNKQRIIGCGYNGMPDGCSDDEFPWDREEKHDYVIHAEQNAILNATQSLEGSTMYLYSERGFYPCNECAKLITQSKISELVLKFVGDDLEERYKGAAAKKMFKSTGIKIRVLE